MNINKDIEGMICKGAMQKSIGKNILLVSSTRHEEINRVESTLINQGYSVTAHHNPYSLQTEVFEHKNLIYVDCIHSQNSLEVVINKKKSNALVVAIINENCSHQQTEFDGDTYDYISISISSTRLIHKTNLYLLYYAASIWRIFDKEHEESQHCNAAKSYSLVEAACDHMINNMPGYTSLEQLCRSLGTNRNTLNNAFKNELGMGAYSWLRQARIAKATHLLEQSDIAIQCISFEVGYENPANFSTTFKSIMGMSPKQYRKLHNQNKD